MANTLKVRTVVCSECGSDFRSNDPFAGISIKCGYSKLPDPLVRMTITISGPPKCGKTTLLNMIKDFVLHNWKQHIVAVDFEELTKKG